MKRFKIFSLIAAVVFTFSSCTEFENPVQQRGEAVVASVSDINPAVFDSNDLTNTFIQFVVNIDESEKSKVSEAAIQVSLNGNMERKELLKVSAFPSTVKIKLADIATKLGVALTDIKLGDVLNIEVLTNTNGKLYRSNAAINAAVVCAYNPTLVSGSYHSVSPDWQSEGDITISVDPADEYTLYVAGLETIEGLDEDQGPLKLIVNPVDYSVEAVKTVLASDAWGYHNIAYEGAGNLSTCDGTFTMNFAISVDEGPFGTFAFIFTKN
jgi:hypothetical protein